ncbi:DUF6538 domain-containing protein [Sulfitobacter sp. HI0023]|uniref:DUF6538 domain-containing protein n=1 Tax=unclassified Sulfitobacter TaxID=196795 RepID=UPI003FCEC88E
MFSHSDRKAQGNRVDSSLSQNAVSHSAEGVTQTVTQSVTQDVSRPPSPRHRETGTIGRRPSAHRPAGPYLQRRGRIFYFRKCLPNVISKNVSRDFFCISLRTPFLAKAMSRAARLLATLKREERPE